MFVFTAAYRINKKDRIKWHQQQKRITGNFVKKTVLHDIPFKKTLHGILLKTELHCFFIFFF